jgi:hypothetical protein
MLACNADRTWQGLSDNPRTFPSEGAQLCTYESWMTLPDPLTGRRRVLHAHLDAGKIRSFLRFRTSCHNLQVDKGWQGRPRIPRMTRFCKHCTMNGVFECPAVQHVRDQYAHLFAFSTSTMRTLLYTCGKMISSVLLYMMSHVWISKDDIDFDGRTFIITLRIVIKHMQNGSNSGCSALGVKCKVSIINRLAGPGRLVDDPV